MKTTFIRYSKINQNSCRSHACTLLPQPFHKKVFSLGTLTMATAYWIWFSCMMVRKWAKFSRSYNLMFLREIKTTKAKRINLNSILGKIFTFLATQPICWGKHFIACPSLFFSICAGVNIDMGYGLCLTIGPDK